MRERMAAEEGRQQFQKAIGDVFEHIMAGVRETMGLGKRETATPLFEIIAVEDEIALSPADQYRLGLECPEAVIDLLQ